MSHHGPARGGVGRPACESTEVSWKREVFVDKDARSDIEVTAKRCRPGYEHFSAKSIALRLRHPFGRFSVSEHKDAGTMTIFDPRTGQIVTIDPKPRR
jgi:hypothetical protein